ncbi:hypothetical protein DX914_17930 [Lysobacter silvisoli]|uniref:Uncharacterized protein n=2 Tax=Lysobacter silvisoli TaxID=2293254 RepID=A0A371JWX0_9GAMM|nr:hypothetical protein DX914_17930 [Lysobacter silvisoli]
MWPLREDPPVPVADDAQALFRRLSALCGQAYLGRVVADIPENAADPYSGRALVMHVRECGKHEIRIPFQVGSDRSRTWVLAQHGHGLQLRHDHRHADGSEDPLSHYGGSAERIEVAGGRIEAEFPADAASRSLFRRLGRPESAQNVWTVALEGERFVYKLARPGRLFRVEFDLSRPLATPPPPWGASDPPPAPAKPKPGRAPKAKKPR